MTRTFYKNFVLGFISMGLIFLTMATVDIASHIWQLETIPVTHRVPTATWRAVIINCCGHNSCLTERHHEVIQFEYKTEG